MKQGEVKLKLVNVANSLIDTYFETNSITDRFINSAMKTMVQANVNKLDNVLPLFTDDKGNVLINTFVEYFTNGLIKDGAIQIDVQETARQLGVSPMITKMLPPKILNFTQDEINMIKTTLK